MENYLPNPVPETNNYRRDWNKLLDYLRRMRPQSSSDITVNETTHGTSFTVSDRIKKKYNTASGSAANFNMRGIWSATPPSPYMNGDAVSYGSGQGAGTYYSVLDGNSNLPTSGIGWISMGGFNIWV